MFKISRDLVIFHLRPWSFESRAVLRAFHSVRWLFNATAASKTQSDLLKKAIGNNPSLLKRPEEHFLKLFFVTGKIFAANALRGGQGEPPLIFSEIQALIVEVASEAGCQTSALRMGSCYSGVKKSPEADLLSKIEAYGKEIEALKAKKSTPPPFEGHRGGGGGRGGRGGRGRGRGSGGRGGGGAGGRGGSGAGATSSLNDKLAKTCHTWNAGKEKNNVCNNSELKSSCFQAHVSSPAPKGRSMDVRSS